MRRWPILAAILLTLLFPFLVGMLLVLSLDPAGARLFGHGGVTTTPLPPNTAGWFLSDAVNDFAYYPVPDSTSDPSTYFNNGVVVGTSGINFHTESGLAWIHAGGDWIDKNSVVQGTTDYATVTHAQNDITSNLTADVKQLLADTGNAQPQIMMSYASGGLRFIQSRFDPTTGNRPTIAVVYTDTSTDTLANLTGTSLDTSTSGSINAGCRSPPFVAFSAPQTSGVQATFTGTSSGTNLTTSAVTGTIHIGDTVAGAGPVAGGAAVLSQTSGTTGGAGVYVTDRALQVSAASLTASSTQALGHLTVDGSGVVNALVMDFKGSGYSSATATVSDQNGNCEGVTVTPVTVASGQVTGGTINNPTGKSTAWSSGPAWGLRFGAMNVALRFAAPNPAKTISTATLHFQVNASQFSGTATFHINRLYIPTVENSIELGIANNVTQDAALGSQAGIIFACAITGQSGFSVGTDITNCFTQSAVDYGNNLDIDYTGVDNTKIPLVGAGKFLMPTDGQVAGKQSGLKPTIVDCHTATTFGCTDLTTGTTTALQYAYDPTYTSLLVDANYFFITTDTGDQSHSFLDGKTIPLRATHDVTLGSGTGFTTVAGSKSITVHDTTHGASSGDWVRFPYHVSVGGIVFGGDEYDWFKITSIIDANHYTFDLINYGYSGNKNVGYSITSNVVTYCMDGANRISTTGQLLISGSGNAALNGAHAITAAGLFAFHGSSVFCAQFSLTAGNVGSTDDNSASVYIVPGSTVTDSGAVASYSVAGAGSPVVVTLPGHGYMANPTDVPNAFGPGYSQRAAVTVGGVTTGSFNAYTQANLTTTTFEINAGLGSGAGGPVSINSGKARILYATGAPIAAGKMPEEIYVRFYQLLGTDVQQPDGFGSIHGGKWAIGPAHRTTDDGNGGACGSTSGPYHNFGWSNRNQWVLGTIPSDPLYRAFAMGAYSYSKLTCQDDFFWNPGAVIIKQGQWYCIEIRLKLNTWDPTGVTPAAADGIVEAWIDGRKVFSKTNFQWRSNPPTASALSSTEVVPFANLGTMSMWFNNYYGGLYQFPTTDWHIYYKDIAIGTAYIGPMKM